MEFVKAKTYMEAMNLRMRTLHMIGIVVMEWLLNTVCDIDTVGISGV